MIYFNILSKLKAGIMMAGAAVGVSHLVQSTRAGAEFGLHAIAFIILAHILKYHFFKIGYEYPEKFNRDLISGYAQMGRPYLYLYFIINLVAGVGSIIVLGYVTASFVSIWIPLKVEYSAVLLILISFMIVLYSSLKSVDGLVKLLLIILAITTFVATIVAIFDVSMADLIAKETKTISNSAIIYNTAFLLAFMGWMPIPLETSSWSSFWIIRRGGKNNLKQALYDFHIGYILTATLAILFLILGYVGFYGKGISITNSATEFPQFLLGAYADIVGEWIKPIIGVACFATLVSTTITLCDGYPYAVKRTLDELLKREVSYPLVGWIMATIAVAILLFNSMSFGVLVDTITITSFLTAPFIGFINIKLYKQMGRKAPILAMLGLIYLAGFSLLYLNILVGINISH